MLLIAEIFGDRQAGEANTETRAGRFGHLAVDQRGARLLRIPGDDHAAFGHFQPKVVAFEGALAHASELGHAAVLHRDIVYQLPHDHRLFDDTTAVTANLDVIQIRPATV